MRDTSRPPPPGIFMMPKARARTDAQREELLAGMCGVIRRMCRLGGPSPVTGREVYCLVDYDDRELAAALLAYVEGRPTVIDR